MMAEPRATVSQRDAWLVCRSGGAAGTRYPLAGEITRIGRNPDNDVVVQGPLAATVSLQHTEICRQSGTFRVRDLGSTNGTYLDGERIEEADLAPGALLQLGQQGPEFVLSTEDEPVSALDQTVAVPKGEVLSQPAGSGGDDALLSEAVMQARRARAAGLGNQTMVLMRDALNRALRRSRRRSRLIIYSLAALLVLVTSFGVWKISQLKREKTSIDQRIREIEVRLEKADAPDQVDRLISELSAYQAQAATLQQSLLYRMGVREGEPVIAHEIRTVMADFGAESYSVPPEFAERVQHHIERYQGPDRPLIARTFAGSKETVNTMRKMLEQENLPPDLAYVALVESALAPRQISSAGAAGPWQLTPPTARAYGLRVDAGVDERHDLRKSTRAGCRYLRELILDFGSGSSVMLALAAYNLGPTKVKQTVMKVVRDPIKQRDFWYLYRARALPPETREFVPKIFAAIILGRNPGKFGF